MNFSGKGLLFMLLILFILNPLLPLYSQETAEPIPYDPEEFSSGLRTLRRAEIIFFGSVPITFLISGLGWELGQAAAGDSYAFSDEQHGYNVLITAGALSFGIALIDYLLGL